MTDSVTVLIAAGIIIPIVLLLIYAAFRNFFTSARNLKEAVEGELARRRKPDADREAADSRRNDLTQRQVVDPVSAMMAEFRAQAKKSDDAHKAQIRAHVDRKIPPIGDDGRKMIERALRARLAIKHVFPRRLLQRSMSYFGGLPIVPDDFDWPTIHNRQGLLERLTFMAQVACANLPAGPARDMFPDKGYLYFFAPMADSLGPDAAHFVVRYEPVRLDRRTNGRRGRGARR